MRDDSSHAKTRLGRIWLHLRCIGRALAGICREAWHRRRAAAPSKANPYCAPARGPWGETR